MFTDGQTDGLRHFIIHPFFCLFFSKRAYKIVNFRAIYLPVAKVPIYNSYKFIIIRIRHRNA